MAKAIKDACFCQLESFDIVILNTRKKNKCQQLFHGKLANALNRRHMDHKIEPAWSIKVLIFYLSLLLSGQDF